MLGGGGSSPGGAAGCSSRPVVGVCGSQMKLEEGSRDGWIRSLDHVRNTRLVIRAIYVSTCVRVPMEEESEEDREKSMMENL